MTTSGDSVSIEGAGAAAGPTGELRHRPNILLILCDEYRFPVAYESGELRQFRSQYLTAEESLRDHGIEFMNHYIMTTASREPR